MQHVGEYSQGLAGACGRESGVDLDRILGNTAYGDSEPREGLASLGGGEIIVKVPPGPRNRDLSATLLVPDDASHHDEQPAIEARHCAAKRGAHR